MYKKILLIIPPLLLVFVCFTTVQSNHSPIQKIENIPVFKFQQKEDLKMWKPSPNSKIEIDKNNWPSFKGSYAKISFNSIALSQLENKKMVEVDNQIEKENPLSFSSSATASVEAPISFLIRHKESLSQYDYLRFRTYNPTGSDIDYTINIKDPTGSGRSIPFFISLKPREEKEVEIDLKAPPLFPRIDLINRYISSGSKKANHIEFQIPLLPQNVSFYVSQIELQKGRKSDDRMLKDVSFSEASQQSFLLIPKSTMEQIYIEKKKLKNASASSKYQLFSAKNEMESFQVVIFPGKDKLTNVMWKLSSLKDSLGNQIPAEINVVGYVDVNVQPRYRIPFLGWYPDPILDSMSSIKEIPSTEVLPLLIKVNVPKGSAPGKYLGSLEISADQGSKKLDVELEVWDFELPTRSSTRFLSQFYRLSSMSQFMPPKIPENTFAERSKLETERFENWMLSYRIQPGNIYSASPPSWDNKRLKELVDKGLNSICLSYVRIDRKSTENYNEKQYWDNVESQINAIKKYIPTLKESGIWGNDDVLKYIFLFDEWPGSHSDIVYQTAKRLKDEFPTIKLITTMTDFTYGLNKKNGEFIDIWVPHVDILQSNKMYIDFSRNQNKQFGWYFAVGAYSPYPNFWIENNVIESRVAMGAISYKYEVPLFIYWANNRWFNNNPRLLDGGLKTKWKAQSYGTKAKNIADGEGSIFYARTSKSDGLGSRPVSTLRLENIRDGLEDYEYFILLNNLYKAKGINKKFQLNKDVIENVGKYTNDPNAILIQRKQVAEEILKIQAN